MEEGNVSLSLRFQRVRLCGGRKEGVAILRGVALVEEECHRGVGVGVGAV